MRTRVQAHTAYRLLYHVVWIPKKRYNLMRGVQKYCEKVIKGVISDRYDDVVIEEINVQDDHIHVMIVIPSKYGISAVIGDIKRGSSRIIRRKFDHIRNGREALWSIGYFVSSVGLDEARVRRYIKYQQQQDSGQQHAEI